MWSLLAVTPGVQMPRIDVGGNRAGTQTAYSAYGLTGQVRVLIEGINTTEGTGGAGFYFDYSSLEEVFLGTSGQSAEMPNPGVQCQFIAKSGGNQFNGEYYLDWYNNSLQGANIPDDYITPTAFSNSPASASTATRWTATTTTAINVGGPIKKDKLWWFGTYNKQFNAIAQPNFAFDKTFDTKLWNAVGKGTYQMNQNNKFIGYYQWGQKMQPNRLPGCTGCATYTYSEPGPTNKQDSGSWVYKGEWNGTISDKLYVEARYGDFGYYFPQITNGDRGFLSATTAGSPCWAPRRLAARSRPQAVGPAPATYFLDTGKGSHTFKVGGELLGEVLGRLRAALRRQHRARSTPTACRSGVFRVPDGDAGRRAEGARRTSRRRRARHIGLFVNDTWTVGRLTLNGGVRWDSYKGWLPEQHQLAAPTGRSPSRRRPSPRLTCSPGTRLRRASASSTTSPARAAR